MKEDFYFPSNDGVHRIHGVKWEPEETPRAVLQITHGMCEYIERYTPFAEYLNSQGFLVVGHDHLGHGGSVKDPSELGYFCKDHPAETLIEDMDRLRQITREKHPSLPYFMLGHSMGSYLLRMYLAYHGRGLSGAIVMGTGYAGAATTGFGISLVHAFALVHGWKYRSPAVQDIAMGSGSYKRYCMDGSVPDNSWLSKDVENVKRYYSNPKCGFPFTLNGFLGLFQAVQQSCSQKVTDRIPEKLPVLLVSGADDPVGDMGKGVKKTFQMLQTAGVEDVSMKLYPGDRHEILNETDRKQVFEDLLGWMNERL